MFFYKTSYNDKEYKQLHIRNSKRGCQPDIIIRSPVLKPAYRKNPKISADKKKDLVSLYSQNLIPYLHHSFFYNLDAEKE